MARRVAPIVAAIASANSGAIRAAPRAPGNAPRNWKPSAMKLNDPRRLESIVDSRHQLAKRVADYVGCGDGNETRRGPATCAIAACAKQREIPLYRIKHRRPD